MPNPPRRPLLGCVWIASILVFAAPSGCARRNAYAPPPPPEVQVAEPIKRPVTDFGEFTGSTQASEYVEIRARVQGYLDSVNFVDGSDVLKGDLLFVIDRRPYQAQLDQAIADLHSKQAGAKRAADLYTRTRRLIPSGAATQEDVDKQLGDYDVAKADVGLAEAKVREAELNLGFTEVRAPYSGRTGRHLKDVGNLVTADSTVLTTLARYDPMYVYFTVSDTDTLAYLQRKRTRPAGTLEGMEIPPLNAACVAIGLSGSCPQSRYLAAVLLRLATPVYPIQVRLPDDHAYALKGYIDFSDNTIDPGTGTLLLRGVLKNPQPYRLLPGLFCRVRVPISTSDSSLLIPEKSLSQNQQGKFVLVVDGDDIVKQRPVTVGPEVGTFRVVTSGLQATERIVVEGLQRARPEAKVKPVLIELTPAE